MIRVLDISETWVGGQLHHRALVEADSGAAAKALVAMVEDHNAIEAAKGGTLGELVEGARTARAAEAHAAVQQQKAADDAAALAAIHAAGETTITPAAAAGATSMAPAPPAVVVTSAPATPPEGVLTP